MATEIVRAPLLNGQTPDDADSPAGQVLKECLQTLTEQPGFQRLYWGREVENPEMLRLMIDWDNVEAHEKFTKDPIYKPFGERFGEILDMSKLSYFHVPFTPHPATSALSDTVAPITEILTVYFPSSYSSSDKSNFESGLKNLVSAIETSPAGSSGRDSTHKGSAGGWSVETSLPIPDSSSKGQAYVAVLGWTSVEAHMSFRETEPFKQNIHHLRDAKDVQAIEVVHVHFVEITKGGGIGGDMGAEGSAQEEILNPADPGQGGIKTRSDGTTTKNDPGLGGVSNAIKKDRAGR